MTQEHVLIVAILVNLILSLIVSILVTHYQPLRLWRYRWAYAARKNLIACGFDWPGTNCPLMPSHCSTSVACGAHESSPHLIDIFINLPIRDGVLLAKYGMSFKDCRQFLAGRVLSAVFDGTDGAGQDVKARMIADLVNIEEAMIEQFGSPEGDDYA